MQAPGQHTLLKHKAGSGPASLLASKTVRNSSGKSQFSCPLLQLFCTQSIYRNNKFSSCVWRTWHMSCLWCQSGRLTSHLENRCGSRDISSPSSGNKPALSKSKIELDSWERFNILHFLLSVRRRKNTKEPLIHTWPDLISFLKPTWKKWQFLHFKGYPILPVGQLGVPGFPLYSQKSCLLLTHSFTGSACNCYKTVSNPTQHYSTTGFQVTHNFICHAVIAIIKCFSFSTSGSFIHGTLLQLNASAELTSIYI